MRLWIRKSDILNGQRRKASWCPIALAARRKFPEEKDIAMGVTTLRVGPFDKMKRFEASPQAQDFVERFDRGEIPNPGYLTFKEIK